MTLCYRLSFFPVDLSARAVNQHQKTRIRKLQHGRGKRGWYDIYYILEVITRAGAKIVEKSRTFLSK